MRVSILDYTGSGHADRWYAAHLMIFTKNTRIKMSPDGIHEIAAWPVSKKIEELNYMANTIRSSWEFVDYVFLLEDVTRAFTHQLVRTRHASYAQQTMQILQVDATAVAKPVRFSDPDSGKNIAAGDIWDNAIDVIDIAYRSMIANGATVEEARGILPTNIKTNIVVKVNLRTLSEVFASRISPRNLGEFREVALAMRDAVLKVHPWASIFLAQTRDKVLADMDAKLAVLRDREPMLATELLKLVDQIRRG